ncbi:MAG TPA: DUF4476 domain-containing protein [Bacteroidia bacterium]|nr:DUF4476 domain-containing protein [Bacteroidia bacterium]
MKRVLIITAFMIASVQLRASHLASELNLRIADQSWFTVTLDNQAFGTPVNRFHVDELHPGTHFLRVTRLDHGYYGPYSVPVVIFNGYIDIPAQSRINAMIDRQFRFRINKIFPLMPVHESPYCNTVPDPYASGYVMSDFDFDQLRNTIDRLSFESSKMQVVRQAISSNYFTARQVTELARLMTFESSKLDLAKNAYHKTIDKQNYFMLNDTFTFESSILDLNEYINRS